MTQIFLRVIILAFLEVFSAMHKKKTFPQRFTGEILQTRNVSGILMVPLQMKYLFPLETKVNYLLIRGKLKLEKFKLNFSRWANHIYVLGCFFIFLVILGYIWRISKIDGNRNLEDFMLF